MQHRQIVENPKRTTLRGRDQFFFAFLDHEICNRSNRKIELHRLPIRPVVERNVNAGFSAGIKQAAFVWIFADHAGEGAIRNACGDLRPGLAIVARLVEIRFVVVMLVHRRRHVRSPGIKGAGIERVDLNPLRH